MGANAKHSLLKDFLTEYQLAAELGLSVRTLRRWRRERTGPAITKYGKSRVYHVDAVRRWLAASEVQMQ